MDILTQTYFSDILHSVTQVLLLPVVIGLLALMVYALWCLGSFVVEWCLEHRHFTVQMPRFLDELAGSSEDGLPRVVCDSGLLGSQKRALLTLWDYRTLPVDAHVSLAKRLLSEEEDMHARVVSRTQTVSKIAPMLGLMGTLIPLGPGLVKLGVGDTLTLSSSLLVAFDTTVAGLVVALITYVITKVRQRWYDNYMGALEAAATTMLEKVDAAREAGEIAITEPTNLADELIPVKASRRGDRKRGKSGAGGSAAGGSAAGANASARSSSGSASLASDEPMAGQVLHEGGRR